MSLSERELKCIGRFIGLTELVGLLGLLASVVMLVEGESVAAGVFLVAAAVAAGLGANALLLLRR